MFERSKLLSKLKTLTVGLINKKMLFNNKKRPAIAGLLYCVKFNLLPI